MPPGWRGLPAGVAANFGSFLARHPGAAQGLLGGFGDGGLGGGGLYGGGGSGGGGGGLDRFHFAAQLFGGGGGGGLGGGAPMRGGSAPQLARGGGRALAQLSLLNRDFGEADYEMLLQLDEEVDGQKKKAGLKQNAKLLEALPTRRYSRAEAKANEGNEPTCAICLEGLRAQQQVVTLPCKHDYHRPCILKWLKQCDAPSCPQCKAPALAPGDDDDEAAHDSGAHDGGLSRPREPPAAPRTQSPEQSEWWHT